ncbi:aspartate kinase [Candidatus Gracilibacteria bacterium]|nr:aspartate kinase [Candidatus Gracilibacteria bacterium]
MLVAKFGGTSMGTADSIRKVAAVVKERGIETVVVSATSGTTDQLIKMGEIALAAGDWAQGIDALVQKHDEIIEELGLDLSLEEYYEDLRKLLAGIEMIGELSASARDRLMSFGERMSSEILAELLDYEQVNGFDVMFCDDSYGEGEVDFERTGEAVRERCEGKKVVITGFVGRSSAGNYITLGRGGSDYTGAIVAAVLGAEELQIWTDVDGVMNCDPRLVKEAKVLEEMSFGEASELAYFGAKVIHPKTIQPAIEQNIAVRILNTFNPAAVGTLIKDKEGDSLKSVTYKKGITIVNICSSKLLNARGFIARIFEVFARNEISVDVVATSEVSVSLTIDVDVPAAVVNELEEFSTVKVIEDLAIVCLVGDGIRESRGVLGKLFTALDDHNIKMVSLGASKRNITFLVEAEEAQEVTKKVFNTFF